MNLVLMGAPGAGKGTQVQNIREVANWDVIATGNLLREAIRRQTPLGVRAGQYMERGELVPDEIVIGLVSEKLAELDGHGVIFDGFPRTVAQAQALDGILHIDMALFLNVEDEVILSRMSGRLTCPKCGAVYHMKFNPPEQEGVCSQCGGPLTVRVDDTIDVVRHRLEVYHAQTEPIIAYYRKQGVYKEVKGMDDLAETNNRVLAALGVE